MQWRVSAERHPARRLIQTLFQVPHLLTGAIIRSDNYYLEIYHADQILRRRCPPI